MKLSIIVPCYNAGRFLAQCLDSIFAQTISDYEVICVNDGSTDETQRILEEYKNNHSNMLVISQENAGMSCARNAGMNNAKGEYIGFVDSDDFIAPNMFEKMIARAEETDSDVVVSNPMIYENQNGNQFPFHRMLDFFHCWKKAGFFAADYPVVFTFVGAWDKIYKRSLLQENNISFIPHRIYEDMPFSFQALCAAKKVSCIKECVYFYRKNAGGSITDLELQKDEFANDFMKNAYLVKELLKQKDIYEKVAVYFLYYILEYGMMHQFHIKSQTSFEKYFDRMREFLDDYDYSVIEKLKIDSRFLWYANIIKSGDVRICRKMIVSKYRGEN